MFETTVAKITNALRNVKKGLGAATRTTPWLAPIAILAFFFLL
ncbi:MAG: hypothetical protein JWP01_3440 [Myxococcales bacterium]|nr:hypothetical protein [Myxococcales bacterium]